MKKIYAPAIVFLMLALFVSAFPAEAAPLPDVLDEWHATPIATTKFDTASEDLGRWQNRVYTRSAPIANIEVNLMEGPGPGSLRVPSENISRNDAPLGFVSTYETLNIAEKRAILERGEVTGQALAVALDTKRTLTIESKSVSREELIDFAERLIHVLQQAD